MSGAVSIFGQGAVVAAAVAGAVAAIGWFVVHRLEARRADDERRAKAELAFVERQIEELYGPLVSILHEGRRNFKDLLISLGRNYVFSGTSPLPPEELKTWLYWSETEFLPRNEKIRKLLHAKAHLIPGAEFPSSYVDFFEHASSWSTNHRRWKQEGVEYIWRSRVAWPEAFEKDVFAAFRDLKQRHDTLLGRISAGRN